MFYGGRRLKTMGEVLYILRRMQACVRGVILADSNDYYEQETIMNYRNKDNDKKRGQTRCTATYSSMESDKIS